MLLSPPISYGVFFLWPCVPIVMKGTNRSPANATPKDIQNVAW